MPKKLRFLFTLIALFGALSSFSPASAQGSTPTPTPTPGLTTYTFDFVTSDQGWVPDPGTFTYGTWVSGEGWVPECHEPFGAGVAAYSYLDIQYPFAAGFTITSIDVVFDRRGGTFSPSTLTDNLYHDTLDVSNRFVSQDESVLGDQILGHFTWSGSQVLAAGTLGVEIAYGYGQPGTCAGIDQGSGRIQSITVQGYGLPFPTQTPTPTITPTPILSATPYGGYIPQVDTRPRCTVTPIMTDTPSRTPRATQTLWPSMTPNPSMSPTATIEGADLYAFVTATPSATRAFGDCSSPMDWLDSSTQIPIIELPSGKCIETTATPAVTEEATFQPGAFTRCKEDCYTVLPDVNIGFSVVATVINFFTGATTIDPSAAFVLEKTTYCFSYEALTLKTMGFDWSPLLELMATTVMGLWLLDRMVFKP